MNIPITIDCNELSHVDTPPCPQTHGDLASVEYRKAQLGSEAWTVVLAVYWSALIADTLKRSRN